MKAVILNEHGGPEVLKYADVPTPEPGMGELLVKIRVSALNRLDLWVRNGWPGIRLAYPHILGSDGAGEIAAVGDGVAGWEAGERVVVNANVGCGHCEYCIAGQDNLCRNWNMIGETMAGTYAEYIVVPEKNVVRIPDGFGDHEAAASGLVYQTGWHSLIVRGKLKPGETVLVVGASGGMNTAYIQLAKLAGAIVYVVGSSTEKLKLAESLGADYLIDRSEEANWSKSIYLMTNKRGVDIVVDNVGTTYPLSFRAARKGGRILTVGNTGGPKFEIDNRFVFGKHLSLIGSTMGTLDDFAKALSLVFAGKIKPVLDMSFPIEEIRTAHERLENGQQMGKITLEVQ